MYISARNQFQGTISAVTPGPVNTEVIIELPCGSQLIAVVTSVIAQRLGLEPGSRAVGLVKALAVTLVTDGSRYRFSAANQFVGRVTRVVPGVISSEVSLSLPGGHNLTAVVTNAAAFDLQLQPGKFATALIEASQVIVGVAA